MLVGPLVDGKSWQHYESWRIASCFQRIPDSHVLSANPAMLGRPLQNTSNLEKLERKDL